MGCYFHFHLSVKLFISHGSYLIQVQFSELTSIHRTLYFLFRSNIREEREERRCQEERERRQRREGERRQRRGPSRCWWRRRKRWRPGGGKSDPVFSIWVSESTHVRVRVWLSGGASFSTNLQWWEPQRLLCYVSMIQKCLRKFIQKFIQKYRCMVWVQNELGRSTPMFLDKFMGIFF